MKHILLLLFISITACASNPPGLSGAPILAFQKVRDGIYRGAQPDQAGVNYLKRLGVKTIIDINDTGMEQERAIAQSAGIDFESVPLSGFWAPKDSDVNRIESIMTDPHYQPVYVHCQHGHDRTGLVVAIERIETEHWPVQKARDEMLALGFHPILLGLNSYFWQREGSK